MMIPTEFTCPDASEIINNKELEEIINAYGSFLTIVSNKPISCVTMFMMIAKHPVLQKVLVEVSETTWYSLVEYLAYRYPILNKSKKIK
jgi:hypothetical protein